MSWYPPSCNTVVRDLVERVTGVVTGSENRPSRHGPLERTFAVDHDLDGEGVTKRVRVTTSHFPERPGFACEKNGVVLLVRNAFDAVDSGWDLNMTNTHTARQRAPAS